MTALSGLAGLVVRLDPECDGKSLDYLKQTVQVLLRRKDVLPRQVANRRLLRRQP